MNFEEMNNRAVLPAFERQRHRHLQCALGNSTHLSVRLICKRCEHVRYVTVKREALKRWTDGESIHRAFPRLSAEMRGFLSTGICPACWDECFTLDEAL